MKTDISSTPSFLSVSIYLFGDELNPSEVTKEIGVQPKKYWRKGETSVGQGKPIKRRTGVWAYTIESSDIDLSKALDELFAAIPIQNDLRQMVPGVSRVRCAVFVSSTLDQYSTSCENLNLSSRHIKLLSNSGAELGIDVTSGPEG